MTNSSSTNPAYAAPDAELWQSLKSAIANSSGFQSWCSEQSSAVTTSTSTDNMVRLYLRETLETLAY
ncbi:hypothetical protein [cf. Phormidesmis sp. LEGE 11477]|uniref:hypothetical protein n=1 Tax=cf. Phormidesmis sp. LEGE 11477 TaxID=1828680 RepID=UPI001880D049|nr:hypothetical protein [cf. Phormidesmis sp. LEGE 11477]MBE9061015.1 hypothetical protein [cf. Phormidesmis sp. LEGE 11477]